MRIRFYTFLPSTTMCRSKESIKLRSPGEYFLIPFFTVRSRWKQEDNSLSVLRDFLFTVFLKARSMYGGRPPLRRPEDAMFWWQGTYVFAVKMCTVDRVMDELVKSPNVWQLIVYLRIWDNCPYFLAIFTYLSHHSNLLYEFYPDQSEEFRKRRTKLSIVYFYLRFSPYSQFLIDITCAELNRNRSSMEERVETLIRPWAKHYCRRADFYEIRALSTPPPLI